MDYPHNFRMCNLKILATMKAQTFILKIVFKTIGFCSISLNVESKKNTTNYCLLFELGTQKFNLTQL